MKFIKRLLIFAIICIILGVTTIFGFYLYVKPELPDVATLKNVELQTPMQVFSADGKLISQFGEQRRIPLTLDEIPPQMINAVLATEDSRYYDHPGIDPIGIARAAFVVATSGSAKQGASTITQQLARNFFLSNEKKIMRKVKEIFIAIHIEQLLSKDEILELYLNKIYLGYRAYGVGAAAQVYYGKDVSQLTLSEIAVIAGLPKAPSTMNPLYSVSRATARRNVVLGRMLAENHITQAEFDQARAEPVVARYHTAEIELSAPYFAEQARAWMINRYGEDAYTSGMRVFTTADPKLQTAAQQAAIDNLLGYDQRHGFRGAVETLWKSGQTAWSDEQINDHLTKQPTYGQLVPAVVTQVEGKTATVLAKGGEQRTLGWEGMKWARKFITDDRQGPAPSSADDILASGQQIWIQQRGENWVLSQVPDANTAFVAVSPQDGAVKAMVGGFNFVHSKFNRATQSVRQVGSAIKPFIYSAALDNGMTLASLVNDAPINRWDQSMGTAWRPKNSPPTYNGPTRLRIGLAQSKNVMAVRVLQNVGLDETIDFLTRFGFKKQDLPRAEPLALGAGSLTPLEVAQGFAVFANGGYYVEPHFIDRVEDPNGNVVYQASPTVVCSEECQYQQGVASAQPTSNPILDDIALSEEVLVDEPQQAGPHYAQQVISEQNAFLVREMLESNIWGGGDWRHGTGWNGTGWRGQVLKRRDIGGKTGTTNDSKDAWYSGFAPGIVATAWVGFDDHSRNLGRTAWNNNDDKNQISGAEAGAKTAQPAWIEFMKNALEDVPVQRKQLPEHIIQVRIDRDSGKLSNQNDYTSMFEYFEEGTEPTESVSDSVSEGIFESDSSDELF
ncbi:penicillin-sensitive transpeptidase [Photobacterium gaetbulicola]|uniref:Penicillin-binding protein 1A n=1 Tax=Photobacterium gaetbulicola Gung47 TaxID=658445 RepID=A0A0C5WJF8_9GAMM|nr:PBP1A family penicillin-binding protein [Photobacterium gaetbulicola]AJR07268.1 putative penicillin-binding protein 1A [Photobacterium gaetbulicola Gung47]PSU13693.1 penicillin-sensitive transpeptidase [Photobacterium gaetbulicola]